MLVQLLAVKQLGADNVLRQILLVGDSGVGKSSLLMRFTADQFEDSSAPTIGAHHLHER